MFSGIPKVCSGCHTVADANGGKRAVLSLYIVSKRRLGVNICLILYRERYAMTSQLIQENKIPEFGASRDHVFRRQREP